MRKLEQELIFLINVRNISQEKILRNIYFSIAFAQNKIGVNREQNSFTKKNESLSMSRNSKTFVHTAMTLHANTNKIKVGNVAHLLEHPLMEIHMMKVPLIKYWSKRT